MVEVKIKKAKIENLKDIQKLNLLLFKKEYKTYDKLLDLKWTFGKEGTKYFKDTLTKKKSCVFIAIVENKIVGYLAGEESKGESYRNLPKMAELNNMFILKEYRRNGVGSKLYGAFIDWCKKRKVKIIRVEATAQNPQAIDFYRKKGFEDYNLTLEANL